MEITEDIRYIGVNDYTIDLFEGMYVVPNGMSYNSYVILDEKIAVMDTVGEGFTKTWLDKLQKEIGNRKPDYLIVQHMEPDHSANIINFIQRYPDTVLVASSHAFRMMKNYFGTEFTDKRIVVSDGDVLSLGNHKLMFAAAPMVHWPEVIVTYDSTDKVLFSADGFGKFGAVGVEEEWACEARRYYFGIVGKYGAQVQALLRKISAWDIQMICPLHGPVLKEDIPYYTNLYNIWSGYQPEEEGALIAYTSVYGNTKRAVEMLEQQLKEKGCTKVIVTDLARCDMAEAVEDAFRYSKLVLATTTYNGGIFPPMREFIHCLTERNFSNRMVGFVENGSWAPMATLMMRDALAKSKNLQFAETNVRILAVPNEENKVQIEKLAEELCQKAENE